MKRRTFIKIKNILVIMHKKIIAKFITIYINYKAFPKLIILSINIVSIIEKLY